MINPSELETERLRLRQWRESDLPSFAKLNNDPEVMRYFPNRLSAQESDALAEKCQSLIKQNGWGFWALELKIPFANKPQFIGLLGLNRLDDVFPVEPKIEIGWRLDKTFWRQGLATEAAQRAVRFAFEELNMPSLVSFTPELNLPSQALMKRIGMYDTGRVFTHPYVSQRSALCQHVIYRLDAPNN